MMGFQALLPLFKNMHTKGLWRFSYIKHLKQMANNGLIIQGA